MASPVPQRDPGVLDLERPTRECAKAGSSRAAPCARVQEADRAPEEVGLQGSRPGAPPPQPPWGEAELCCACEKRPVRPTARRALNGSYFCAQCLLKRARSLLPELAASSPLARPFLEPGCVSPGGRHHACHQKGSPAPGGWLPPPLPLEGRPWVVGFAWGGPSLFWKTVRVAKASSAGHRRLCPLLSSGGGCVSFQMQMI